MYMEDAVSIKRLDDNSFMVQVGIKKKKMKESKDDVMTSGMGSETKTHSARNEKELMSLLKDKLIPNMKCSGMEEDAYNKAFNENEED